VNHEPGNAPAPHDLLLTARESLKSVLKDPDGDHGYIILMAMNAMGIAARAMQAPASAPVRTDISDAELTHWLRHADEAAVTDPGLITGLRRYVDSKLAVSNPRFKPEQQPKDSK